MSITNIDEISSTTSLLVNNQVNVLGNVTCQSINNSGTSTLSNCNISGITEISNTSSTLNNSDTFVYSIRNLGDSLLNRIMFIQGNNGLPTNVSSRSSGTKITFFSNVSNNLGETSIGNDTNTLWTSSTNLSNYILGIKRLELTSSLFNITTPTTNVLKLRLLDTTDSSSLLDTNASMIVEGGMSIKKNLFIGGSLSITGSFQPASLSISGSFEAGVSTPSTTVSNGTNVSNVTVLRIRSFKNGNCTNILLVANVTVTDDFTPSSFTFSVPKVLDFTNDNQFHLVNVSGSSITRLYDCTCDYINNTKLISVSFTSNTTSNHLLNVSINFFD